MKSHDVLSKVEKDVSLFYINGKLDLEAVCKKEEIGLYEANFDNENVSGILIKSEQKWNIYVNKKNSLPKKRFTTAHELGHYFGQKYDLDDMRKYITKNDGIVKDYNILFHKNVPDTGDNLQIEKEANTIANAILMPQKIVEGLLETTADLDKMAKIFGVTESAISFRLESLGYKSLEGIF